MSSCTSVDVHGTMLPSSCRSLKHARCNRLRQGSLAIITGHGAESAKQAPLLQVMHGLQ